MNEGGLFFVELLTLSFLVKRKCAKQFGLFFLIIVGIWLIYIFVVLSNFVIFPFWEDKIFHL